MLKMAAGVEVMRWEPRPGTYTSLAAAEREAAWLRKAGHEAKVSQVAYVRPRFIVLVRESLERNQTA